MKHLTLLSSALLCALALAPNRSSAAWWKGNGWSKNGSLNNDYWEGFGIGYDDWYTAGGHDNINWTDTEAVFEGQPNPYAVTLDDDFTCRNVTAFQGYSGGSMTMDLSGHTFSTVHDAWGFFIKGQNNMFTLMSGTLCVNGKVSLGDDNGSYATLRVQTNATLHARAFGIGGANGGQSSGNMLDVDGGLVLFDVEGGWGYAIGEKSAEDSGTMLVRNGGIVSNLCNSAEVGYKSSNNTLDVRDGGHYYNQNFQQLGHAEWDWSCPTTNNMIRAESGGIIELHSGIYIGDGNDPARLTGNTLWAGDGGEIRCGGDVNMNSSGNRIVVSNGTFVCNSLHSINEWKDDYSTTEFRFAGRAPTMNVWFYFSLRHGADVHFDVPEEGYATTPLTVRNGCKMDEDTDLFIHAKDYQHAGGGRLRLINADMDGNGYQKLYVPDDDESFTKLHALVARWNSTLPEGYSVELSADRCSLWLDVKPLSYTVVLFR